MTACNEYLVKRAATTRQVNWVWHLTHVDNLSSISRKGLLSQLQLQKLQQGFQDISDHDVQYRRSITRVFGHSLHSFVPTFFTKRNPMMYRISRSDPRIAKLVWLKIDVAQLEDDDCITTDGNAAARHTLFWEGKQFDKPDWQVLKATSWCEVHDGSRLRSAELLYRKCIPATAIVGIVTNNMSLQHQLLARYLVAVDCNPYDFFL